VLQEALPVDESTAVDPQPEIAAPPSVNATVPPSGIGATVAVYVICCPTADGSTKETSAVAVEAVLTKALPVTSTATHRPVDWHAIAGSVFAPAIGVAVAPAGEAGLNVTAFPKASTAVHCVVGGHAMPFRLSVLSIVDGVGSRARPG
jgi:hypothetical protein